MLRRTEALVLKTAPFSEADLIVSVLTSEYGLLNVFAKSPRKTKSRFGSSLEPLTHSSIAFWGREDASLPRLTQSDIISPHQAIRESLKYFFSVMELFELALNLLPVREPNRDIFNLLAGALNRIAVGCARPFSGRAQDPFETLLVFYKIRLLDLTGYAPALAGCGRCGKTGYNFYIAHGSVICGTCAEDTDKPTRLLPGTVELYKTMRKWDSSKIDRIRPSSMLLSELCGMLDNHIQYHTTRPLKTKAFRKVSNPWS